MSNPLSVRRVRVQTINENGNPIQEPPSFGILASDSHTTAFVDCYESSAELESAIEKVGSILAVPGIVESFPDADHEKIGTKNYYGKDWMLSRHREFPSVASLATRKTTDTE